MKKGKIATPKYAPYLFGTAVVASFGLIGTVHAETKALEEVIVTAQKREQSIQEVPVAITALTQESLETNRVANVTDLSALAPNLTTRPSAGGSQVASFTMRGVTSYGIAPGSDKEVSIYLDGVYIGAPRGSIFNLPDIAQMEVLRGPQGTLFGRNATAGAINITTRDPSGELGLRQDLSVGNHNYKRNRTTIDSPQWGPFSFLATYVNEERDGDIKNTEGGRVWDRTAFGRGTSIVPDRMGNKDSETYFLAAKFAPTDTFSMVLKIDHAIDNGSAAGASLVWFNPALLTTLPSINPNIAPTLNPSGKRPSSASDAFMIPTDQSNTGYSLTTLVEVSDNWTLKNISAYRRSYISTANDLEGLGQLRSSAALPPVASGPLAGLPQANLPYLVTSSGFTGQADQWSSEFQSNYEAEAYTLTIGGLYYQGEERGGDLQARANWSGFFPGNILPTGRKSLSFNDGNSRAAYSQLEYHLTDTIDLLAGYRLTRDTKSGDFISAGPSPTFSDVHHVSSFQATKPSYMAGVNYKPTFDTLIYGKYSQAFVSGGSVGGFDFGSEIAKSWEAGLKSDFFDSTLRSNLSIFHVDYYHVQSPQSGRNFGRSDLGVIVIDEGQVTAEGFEWEGSASVGAGVTLKASTGYTHTALRGPIDPRLQASVALNPAAVTANDKFYPTLQPNWTGDLGAQYDGEPLFGQSYLSATLDASWHSAMRMDANPNNSANVPGLAQTEYSPASWLVNGRLALKKIDLGFAGGEGEIALWGRNMNDNKYPIYEQSVSGIGRSAQYLDARSYGVDFTAKF